MSRIKGWPTKHPKTFVDGQEYLDFSSKINDTWRGGAQRYKMITAMDGKMPLMPSGIVLFADAKKTITTNEYKKLCNKLKVDAVAIMSVTNKYSYKSRTFGRNGLEATVDVSVKIVNKFGEEAVYHRAISATNKNEVNAGGSFLNGFTFKESPVDIYLDTLGLALNKMVKDINKAL